MTAYRRIYLDANVLIDLAQDQGEVGSLLQQIVVNHAPQRHDPLFLTSELTFSEVLVRPYREKLDSPSRFYLQASQGSYWLQVSPVSSRVLERAAALRAAFKPLKLPAAIHVATAQLNDCSHLLTNDLALSAIPENEHPFRQEVLPAVATILAGADTLSRILKDLS